MRVSDIPAKIEMFRKLGQKARLNREGLLEADNGETIAVIECGQASDGSPLWLHVIDEGSAEAVRTAVEFDNSNRPCFLAYREEIDFLRRSSFMALDLAKLTCVRDKVRGRMVASDGRTYVDLQLHDQTLLRLSFRPLARDWRHTGLKFAMQCKAGYVGEVHIDDALLCLDESQVLAVASLRSRLRNSARSPNPAFRLLYEAQSRTIREQDAELQQSANPRPRRRRSTTDKLYGLLRAAQA